MKSIVYKFRFDSQRDKIAIKIHTYIWTKIMNHIYWKFKNNRHNYKFNIN